MDDSSLFRYRKSWRIILFTFLLLGYITVETYNAELTSYLTRNRSDQSGGIKISVTDPDSEDPGLFKYPDSDPEDPRLFEYRDPDP